MIRMTERPNFSIDTRPNRTDYSGLAMQIREFIKTRTRSGVDVDRRPFRPYSETYRKAREDIGKTSDIVNLEYRSEMHNQLVYKAENTGAEIYYSDADRAKVAMTHQYGLNDMPVRKHFGLNAADSQKFLQKLANDTATRIARQWRSK